jgi:NAD(P)H-hydrate epimerase
MAPPRMIPTSVRARGVLMGWQDGQGGVGRRVPRAIKAADLLWLTADEMREVDRVMVMDLRIRLVQMMENAGRNLAELALERFRPSSATILVGRGGNGGGGMVAARHLSNRGVTVRIAMAHDVEELDPVPRLQLDSVRLLGIDIGREPPPADLVIDAVIGYSLSGDPRGRAAELIAWAGKQSSPVLALDLPSGLDATNGSIGRPCVRATATLTLAMPKAGLRRAPDVVGELYLADISVPPTAYRAIGQDVGPIFALGPILRIE